MLSVDILNTIVIPVLDLIILAFSFYAAFLLLVGRIKHESSRFLDLPLELPTVTVLLVVKEEAEILRYTLQRLFGMKYPKDKLHIMLVVDDDDEETVQTCSSFTGLEILKVKGRRGKASALNQALSHIQSELILLLDSDSILEEDALEKMLLIMRKQNTLAVSGIPYPLNESEGLLPQIFRLECDAWAKMSSAKGRLGLLVQAPGFCSLITTSSIRSIEGWDESLIAEDNDLSLRLWVKGGRACLAPSKVGIEAPAKLGVFIKQRLRWYKGTIDVYRKHFRNILKLDLFKQLDLFFTYLSPTAAALIIPLIITSIVFDGTSRMILLGLFLLQMLSISMVNDGPSKIHKAKLVLIALLYMILQSAICLTAVFLALLSIDLKWTKTEKSGFHIVHTSEDSPKSSLRKACGSQDMLKVLIKEYTTT